jgi:lysophospholipase L1-like esterase
VGVLLGVSVLAGSSAAPGAALPAVTGSGAVGSAPEVVTLGDSVPAGSACGCTPFPELYAKAIGAASENLAEPGATSQDIRDQLDDSTAADAVRRAKVVLVMAGANDLAVAFGDGDEAFAEPAAQVQRNVTVVVDDVHTLSPAASVLVFGYWNVVEDGDVAHDDYGNDGVAEAASATTACNAALSRAAAATGAIYVDTTSAFKGGSGEQNPTALLATDGDHPDAAGQRAIAAAAVAALPNG